MNPTKEQMYQWYVVEQKSFRQIMKLIGTKNNRKIPKLLKEYNIPIRHGSEAIKTQWVNNEERKKKQSEFLSTKLTGKPSKRRIPLSELKNRYDEENIQVLSKRVVDGYTVMKCKCLTCGYVFERSLRNSNKGCLKCGIRKAHEQQRKPFKVIQSLFDDMNLILLSSSYSNAESPLEYICPVHSFRGAMTTSYTKLKQRYDEGKTGCRYCTYDSMRNSELHEARKSWMYKEWRESVFKRDHYTCQCCGDNRGRNLQAHHIENFAENEDLRFDIHNGITLCEPCHNPSIEGSFHYVYGTTNNNRKQLEEYISQRQVALI